MWGGVNRKNVSILILIRVQHSKDLPLCHKSVHLCIESFLRRWRHLLSPPSSCCAPAPAPWCCPASSPPSSNLGSEPSHTASRSVGTAHLQILHILGLCVPPKWHRGQSCVGNEKKQTNVITAREPPRAPRFEILPETGRGAEYERRRGPTLLDLQLSI